MNCDQVNQKYKDYLAEKLPAEECERISDHIIDCFDCFEMDQREKRTRWNHQSLERKENSL